MARLMQLMQRGRGHGHGNGHGLHRVAMLLPRQGQAPSALRALATGGAAAPRFFDYETITANMHVRDAIPSVEAAFGALAMGKVMPARLPACPPARLPARPPARPPTRPPASHRSNARDGEQLVLCRAVL